MKLEQLDFQTLKTIIIPYTKNNKTPKAFIHVDKSLLSTHGAVLLYMKTCTLIEKFGYIKIHILERLINIGLHIENGELTRNGIRIKNIDSEIYNISFDYYRSLDLPLETRKEYKNIPYKYNFNNIGRELARQYKQIEKSIKIDFEYMIRIKNGPKQPKEIRENTSKIRRRTREQINLQEQYNRTLDIIFDNQIIVKVDDKIYNISINNRTDTLDINLDSTKNIDKSYYEWLLNKCNNLNRVHSAYGIDEMDIVNGSRLLKTLEIKFGKLMIDKIETIINKLGILRHNDKNILKVIVFIYNTTIIDVNQSLNNLIHCNISQKDLEEKISSFNYRNDIVCNGLSNRNKLEDFSYLSSNTSTIQTKYSNKEIIVKINMFTYSFKDEIQMNRILNNDILEITNILKIMIEDGQLINNKHTIDIKDFNLKDFKICNSKELLIKLRKVG